MTLCVEGSMRYAALTDTGMVRDKNEDAYYADGRLFIVADGMGGHQAGEVASALAVEEFLRYEKDNRHRDPLRRLGEAVQAANRILVDRAAVDSALKGMGTTFTVLLVENGVYLGHVGDSRAYLLREGILNPLTRDHSLVERMVREGRITRKEARSHPRRNVILRALGLADELAVDLVRVDVRPGDRLLLCTDGLTARLEDADLESILGEEKDLQECARRLVAEANARGGEDNVTVIVIDLDHGDVPLVSAGEASGKRTRGWLRRLRSREDPDGGG